jgi:PmbA protein
MPEQQLEQIAQDLVARALGAGASAADATVHEGEEFSTTIRLGQIESLKEAASKVLGLRVFLGTRSASSYSSDFSAASLHRLVDRTLAMARVTSEDPASALPDPSELGRYAGDLALYYPDLGALSAEDRIRLARRAEEAALSADPRIRNSEGASVETGIGAKAYANSLGFVGSYRSSYGSISVVPVAQEGANGHSPMQRDYWYRRVGRSRSCGPRSRGPRAAAPGRP